MHRFISLVTKL